MRSKLDGHSIRNTDCPACEQIGSSHDSRHSIMPGLCPECNALLHCWKVEMTHTDQDAFWLCERCGYEETTYGDYDWKDSGWDA